MCVCVCMYTYVVVCNSLRPGGLKPTRLLCPQNSSGNNTGVVAFPSPRGSSWPKELNSGLLHCCLSHLRSYIYIYTHTQFYTHTDTVIYVTHYSVCVCVCVYTYAHTHIWYRNRKGKRQDRGQGKGDRWYMEVRPLVNEPIAIMLHTE